MSRTKLKNNYHNHSSLNAEYGISRLAMSRPISKNRAKAICLSALKTGICATGKRFGISRQRVSAICKNYRHMSTVMLESEMFDDDGNMRDFKELRSIFNSWDVSQK